MMFQDNALNLHVDKFGQGADWTTMANNPELSQCVALDAYLHWRPHKELTELLETN